MKIPGLAFAPFRSKRQTVNGRIEGKNSSNPNPPLYRKTYQAANELKINPHTDDYLHVNEVN